MQNNVQFRSAGFGGFNRQDVIDYIQQMTQEHQQRETELQTLADQSAGQLAALREELTSAEENLTLAQMTHGELRREMEALRASVDQQLAGFEQRKQALAELELEAKGRAQQLIDGAQTQAEQILAQARAEAEALLSDAQRRAEAEIGSLQEQLYSLRDQRAQLLDQTQQQLDQAGLRLQHQTGLALTQLDQIRQLLEQLPGLCPQSLTQPEV